MTDNSTPQINEKFLLFILGAIQFTHIVDFMIIMPLGDILQRELNINPSEFSVLVSAYPLAAFLSSLFGVFFLDKFDRKKALVIAYTGFILGTASSALVPTTAAPDLNYYLFIGTRVVTGLFGGILGALVLSIVGDVFPLARRGSAMGIVTMAFSLAAVMGVPLSLYLVNQFDGNWHLPFYFVSGLGFFIILLSLFGVPSMRGHLTNQQQRPHPFETIRVAAKSRNQQQALLLMILLILGQFTVIPFITPYMINNVGLTQDEIPLIYLVGGACTVISSPLVGKLVDRFGRKKVFYGMATLSMAPLLLVTHLWPISLYIVLTISGSFFIFISGRMIPANTMLTSVVKPENRGGFMSLNSSGRSLAGGVASLITGAIVTQEFEGAPLEHFGIVGVMACGFTLLAMYLAYRLVEGE
ncbi:MFS transporter [Sanyastnella coralliicola]|uniref:MFS transporter n=1 Tax=Sanyastnella coralliicola TaxID=3069118 RepID=UPI0027BA6427|nr:MFS transporter [Longitalea sp. SCSIO 12813]